MGAHSLEWNCEELIALKLRTDDRLEGVEIRHHEATGSAATDCIILRATKGENQLAGVAGYDVRVSVTFASGTLDPDQSDEFAAAISEAVYANDPTFAPDLPDLEFASVEPDANTERTDTPKLRKRVVTFPLIARMADTGIVHLLLTETGAYILTEEGEQLAA